MALWLEQGTLNRENSGSNPLAAISNFGQYLSLCVASVRGGYYLCDRIGFTQ